MKKLEISNLEKRVNHNILAQMGLRQVSANALAKQIGRSQPYIRYRVSGERAWSISDLELLAENWGIPVETFFRSSVDVSKIEE